MKYIVTADTDIGISKETNQDSICVRVANTKVGQVVMAIICDGMGGLSKGEVASATVIREFCTWFEQELPTKISKLNWQDIADIWDKMLKNLNSKIMKYGKRNNENIGTTITGMFIMNDKYMVVNVGDSRLYKINSTRSIKQLTEDQTLVQQEIKRGNLTLSEAKKDPRRSVLLQCVGASKTVIPEIRFGKIENKCIYMLCSDGFRHEIEEDEIAEKLTPKIVNYKEIMHENSIFLINAVKSRQEKDNISVILIRTEE